MLGRPFGAPNEPEFQRKVLTAALRLLEADRGPVLQDFPEDAPVTANSSDMEGLACPVNLSPLNPASDSAPDLTQRLLDEVAQLLPWHDLAIKRRRRSTVGISGLGVEDALRYAASHLGATPPSSYDPEISVAEALKRACDDLKAFYYEAAAAQPGNPAGDDIQKWFWLQSAAGKLLLDLKGVCRDSADKRMQMLGGTLLVPRAVVHMLEHRSPR